MSNDARCALFHRVAAVLAGAGIEYELIGGLGVDWLVTETDASLRHDEDPLAHLGRTTNDADIVLRDDLVAVAVTRLRALGLTEDARLRENPFRLHGPGAIVDLIPCPRAAPAAERIRGGVEVGEAAVWLRQALGTWTTSGGLHIAHPAALVVLKALAWRQRGEPRDAADVARLALWDAEGDGRAAAALDRLADRMPPGFADALRRVGEAFADRDANGVSHFIRFLRDVLPEVERDDTLEDEIRARVARAVKTLLAPWR